MLFNAIGTITDPSRLGLFVDEEIAVLARVA